MTEFSFIFCLLVTTSHGASLFDWLTSKEETKEPSPMVLDSATPLIRVPFEGSPEDRFLLEAERINGVKFSELDTCQHKVVMRMRDTCGMLSEEDLAKLSVHLLNCQSAVEGRSIYPCTEDMSLRQCTRPMDPASWNAYHLMNNRAHSICFTTRQQQFRAVTELAVSKLMGSTHRQLQVMAQLQEGHEQLESLSSKTVSEMTRGQKELLDQQDELLEAQMKTRDTALNNLHHLVKEKALISTSHRQLLAMARDVSLKLGEAKAQLTEQSNKQSDKYRQLFSDLELIASHTQSIVHEIGEASDRILALHEITTDHYHSSLITLMKFNSSIHYLVDLVDSARLEIDTRLSWITQIIGSNGHAVLSSLDEDCENNPGTLTALQKSFTGVELTRTSLKFCEQLERCSSLAQHLVFVLFGMLFCSFLQLPLSSRFFLVATTALNLFLAVNFTMRHLALNVLSLAILLAAFAIVERLLKVVFTVNWKTQHWRLASGPLPQKNQQEHLGQESYFAKYLSKIQEGIISQVKGGSQISSCKHGLHQQSSIEDDRLSTQSSAATCADQVDSEECGSEFSYADSILRQRKFINSPNPHQTSSRSVTPSQAQCSALCRNGQPCRNSAIDTRGHCRRHLTYTSPF